MVHIKGMIIGDCYICGNKDNLHNMYNRYSYNKYNFSKSNIKSLLKGQKETREICRKCSGAFSSITAIYADKIIAKHKYLLDAGEGNIEVYAEITKVRSLIYLAVIEQRQEAIRKMHEQGSERNIDGRDR